MKIFERLDVQIGFIFILELIFTGWFFLSDQIVMGSILLVIIILHALLMYWVIVSSSTRRRSLEVDVSRVLGTDVKEALTVGEIGIVTYDENYNITWMSDLLIKRHGNLKEKKIANLVSNINQLFQDDVDIIVGKDAGYRYEIQRKDNSRVLFFKDIGEISELQERYTDEKLVVGLLHLDNYNELMQYSDEQKVTQVSNVLRPLISKYAKTHNIILRRLRSERYYLVLDEKAYGDIKADNFSLLNEIRQESGKIDSNITVSMAFARGSNDLIELDNVVNDLLELALVRGGDQVVTKKHGSDAKFYGGGSQAVEKRSRVRARVMSQAIKEAIVESNKIFIVGHKVMDYDCMGGAIAMSRICASYQKEVYIVSQSGGMDAQLAATLDSMKTNLNKRHRFITDQEAIKLANPNKDLVIVVDHNNPQQSGAESIMALVNKKVVIDHHRRSERIVENPLIIYVETSASSTCELIAEMLNYQTNKVDISEDEANIMYLGILIDTNHFKNRTGVRTFEAAAKLKALGVDPLTAENYLLEEFSEFELKSSILNKMQLYRNGILISVVPNSTIATRTMMSQVADTMLNLKNIEAAFVIGRMNENSIAISARSKEKVNVQFIMEKMHGGGHFNAAALQRESQDLESIETELKTVIDKYLESEEAK